MVTDTNYGECTSPQRKLMGASWPYPILSWTRTFNVCIISLPGISVLIIECIGPLDHSIPLKYEWERVIVVYDLDFFTNHITLRSKSKDWLDWNQDNELSNMSICELQNNIPTKCVDLVHSGHHHVIKCNLFSPWYRWKLTHLALNNNHSLPFIF
jgi:hypothetical protein